MTILIVAACTVCAVALLALAPPSPERNRSLRTVALGIAAILAVPIITLYAVTALGDWLAGTAPTKPGAGWQALTFAHGLLTIVCIAVALGSPIIVAKKVYRAVESAFSARRSEGVQTSQ